MAWVNQILLNNLKTLNARMTAVESNKKYIYTKFFFLIKQGDADNRYS